MGSKAVAQTPRRNVARSWLNLCARAQPRAVQRAVPYLEAVDVLRQVVLGDGQAHGLQRLPHDEQVLGGAVLRQQQHQGLGVEEGGWVSRVWVSEGEWVGMWGCRRSRPAAAPGTDGNRSAWVCSSSVPQLATGYARAHRFPPNPPLPVPPPSLPPPPAPTWMSCGMCSSNASAWSPLAA